MLRTTTIAAVRAFKPVQVSAIARRNYSEAFNKKEKAAEDQYVRQKVKTTEIDPTREQRNPIGDAPWKDPGRQTDYRTPGSSQLTMMRRSTLCELNSLDASLRTDVIRDRVSLLSIGSESVSRADHSNLCPFFFFHLSIIGGRADQAFEGGPRQEGEGDRGAQEEQVKKPLTPLYLTNKT